MWRRFLSRKWVNSILAFGLPIVNATMGSPLNEIQLGESVGALVTFIIVEGIRDMRNDKHKNGNNTVTIKNQ